MLLWPSLYKQANDLFALGASGQVRDGVAAGGAAGLAAAGAGWEAGGRHNEGGHASVDQGVIEDAGDHGLDGEALIPERCEAGGQTALPQGEGVAGVD